MKTVELEKRLGEESEFDERLIADNAPPKIYELIEKYLAEKNISRSELIRLLNFDRNYGYQILNGTRKPTRIHLLKIGLVLGLDLEDFQELLKVGEKGVLYARKIEDAKIIYSIEHKLDYEKSCEFIWGISEKQ